MKIVQIVNNVPLFTSYLLVDGDRIELRDAGDLWHKKHTAETENILKKRHGENFQVASIGKGAENLCRFWKI